MPNFDGSGGGSSRGGGGFQGEGESQSSQDAISRSAPSPSPSQGQGIDAREQAIARSGQSRTGTQGRPQSDNAPPVPSSPASPASPLASYDMFGNPHVDSASAAAADAQYLGQSQTANQSDAFTAGLTGIPWDETEAGKQGSKIGVAGTIASAVLGVPALGIIARGLSNRYTPEAKAYNLGRAKAGLSHYDLETGVWTSDTFDLFKGLKGEIHPGPPRGLNEELPYGEEQPPVNLASAIPQELEEPEPEPTLTLDPREELKPRAEKKRELTLDSREKLAPKETPEIEQIKQEFELKLKQEREKMAELDAIIAEEPVSYTHLTLPTKA